MNLDKLTDFAIAVVIIAALTGNLPGFHQWVQVQTAKLLYASRASAWGSPMLFK